MSKEFKKLEALLDLSEPSEREPQVDRGEAAETSPPDGDGCFIEVASSASNFRICGARLGALLEPGNASPPRPTST